MSKAYIKHEMRTDHHHEIYIELVETRGTAAVLEVRSNATDGTLGSHLDDPYIAMPYVRDKLERGETMTIVIED